MSVDSVVSADGGAEFEPGSAVWVRIPRHPWWPGLVVHANDVPKDVTRYHCNKPPLAYVKLVPEDAYKAVTNKKHILPFNHHTQTTLVEAGQGLRRTNLRLRLEFDCGVKAVLRHLRSFCAMENIKGGPSLPGGTSHASCQRLSPRNPACRRSGNVSDVTVSGCGEVVDVNDAPGPTDSGKNLNDGLQTTIESTLSTCTNNSRCTVPDMCCSHSDGACIEACSHPSGRISADCESNSGSSSHSVMVSIKRELYEENYKPQGNKGVTNSQWTTALSPSHHSSVRTPGKGHASGLYRCDVCSFTTQRLGNIMIHQRMHSSKAKESGQLLRSMHALSQAECVDAHTEPGPTLDGTKRQLSFTCPTPPRSVTDGTEEEHQEVHVPCAPNVTPKTLKTDTTDNALEHKCRTENPSSQLVHQSTCNKKGKEGSPEEKHAYICDGSSSSVPTCKNSRKRSRGRPKGQKRRASTSNCTRQRDKPKKRRGSFDPNVMEDACDSSSSSDGEDLPDVFASAKERICEGELAWVQFWKYPFWPCLVKRVYLKRKQVAKVTVIFLGTPDVEVKHRKMTIRYNPKTILPFGGQHKRHAALKAEGESSLWAVEFKPAVQKAEDFLWKRCLGEATDAFIFFKEDLGDVSEAFDLSDEDTESTTASTFYSPPASEEEEKEKEEEPIEQDIQEQDSMSTALQKRIEKNKERSRILIDFIRNKKTKEYLQKVQEGTRQSWRHELFHKPCKSREDNFLLKHQGFGPIDDEDQRMEVLTALNCHSQSCGLSKATTSHLEYLWQVWVPEAIVFALSKVRRISFEKADVLFKRGVKRTKEEHRLAREEIIKSSANIDAEDKARYNRKILMKAAELLKETR